MLLRQRLASESKNATVNSKPETGTEAEARYARADTGATENGAMEGKARKGIG